MKKLRRIAAAVLCGALLLTGATVLAAGTSADPILSRSYLKTVFSKPMEEYWSTAGNMLGLSLAGRQESWAQAAQTAAAKRVADALAPSLQAQVQARAAELLAQQTTGALTAGMRRVTLKKGDRITVLEEMP